MKMFQTVNCFLLTVSFLFFASISEAGLLNLKKNQDRVQKKTAAQPVQLVVGTKTPLIRENSLDGWTAIDGKIPGNAWRVEDGVLHLHGKGGDVMTDREYKNFVLDFTWTIAEGGNSGIKYRFKKYDGKGWLGLEYQVLDDFNSKEGKKPKNNTATLYDILSTNDSKILKPHEELNHGRIVVNGNRIEHWLNGKKVVDVLVGSERWKKAVAASKFNDIAEFGENAVGRIMVQDHGCEVRFHDITIGEIIKTTAKSKHHGFLKRKYKINLCSATVH
ncbi:MAG: DUF1080 domain-containing protein [Planctomycetaceae bacterium]|jgi:hypothetical protein|nr:DUF1080 domain-containing protein [Planctomycetaceae bacterium]